MGRTPLALSEARGSEGGARARNQASWSWSVERALLCLGRGGRGTGGSGQSDKLHCTARWEGNWNRGECLLLGNKQLLMLRPRFCGCVVVGLGRTGERELLLVYCRVSTRPSTCLRARLLARACRRMPGRRPSYLRGARSGVSVLAMRLERTVSDAALGMGHWLASERVGEPR